MEQMKSIFRKLKAIFRAIKLRTFLMHLEFHLADHCNLNCVGCTHFSNISEPKFVDARMLENRFDRLNELIGYIYDVRILGGEPLLHPDIIDVLKITRKKFPFSKIELYTNGLLLDKMSEEFFTICKKNKILIYVSKYSVIENKINKIKEILSSYKVKYCVSPTIINFSANLNPNGNTDKNIIFKNCIHKDCTILKEDKIYLCPICAYIDKYNKYFNKNIAEPKGINIFSCSSKELFNYLKTAEETCRYCTNNTNYINWACSNNPKETDWNGEE